MHNHNTNKNTVICLLTHRFPSRTCFSTSSLGARTTDSADSGVELVFSASLSVPLLSVATAGAGTGGGIGLPLLRWGRASEDRAEPGRLWCTDLMRPEASLGRGLTTVGVLGCGPRFKRISPNLPDSEALRWVFIAGASLSRLKRDMFFAALSLL